MNLIILEPHEVSDAGDVTLTGARAVHLLTVLAVGVGQQVRCGLLDGPRGVGVVQSVAVADASVRLHCVFDAAVPSRASVDLLLALPRPKVLRRLLPQIAALGVNQILLTNAERVERCYFDAQVLHPERCRPLLIEGLQQARDTRLPTLSIHKQLKVLVEDHLQSLTGNGLRLVGDPSSGRSVGVAVRERGAAGRVLMAVGPEGGWNAFELRLLSAHGFQPISLGPRTLRVDTACIALLTLVHDALSSSP